MRPLLFGFAVVAVATLAVASMPASAQVSTRRYRTAPSASDGFGLVGVRTAGHLALDARLGLDYAHAPIVVSDTTGETRQRVASVVENALTMDLAVGLGITDRFAFHVAMPFVLGQGGGDAAAVEDPDAQAVGDLSLVLRGHVLGEREPPAEGFAPALGVVGELSFPTGGSTSLASDLAVGARLTLVGALTSKSVTPILNVGVAYRPERTYLGATTGTELTYGVGAHVSIDVVRIEAELRGATTITGEGASTGDGTALELLAGASVSLVEILRVGAAIDFGLTQAIGVPDVRALLTVGVLVPLVSSSEDDEDDGGDGSGGGGEDDESDPDGDDVLGASDGCPDAAEDRDGNADDDGCPEEDADGDGVNDPDDFCPAVPEVRDGVADDDGCPDEVDFSSDEVELPGPIRFARRERTVSQGAAGILGLVARALRDHPEVVLLQIEGHAARDEGTERGALATSESRAEAVVEWLVAHGVESSRVTFVGLGADQPADANDLDANRRVTLRVLERR